MATRSLKSKYDNPLAINGSRSIIAAPIFPHAGSKDEAIESHGNPAKTRETSGTVLLKLQSELIKN